MLLAALNGTSIRFRVRERETIGEFAVYENCSHILARSHARLALCVGKCVCLCMQERVCVCVCAFVLA